MPANDLIIVYLYCYLPAVILMMFFWWMDRFEREPFYRVVMAFLWGAFGAGLLSLFTNTFIHVALNVYQQGSQTANDMIGTVIVAPFVEELTKGVFIAALLFFNKVDNLTDGIVLGIAVGLGFAAEENVFYAVDRIYPSSGELAMWANLWFRELHTTLLHASATAVWGAFLGYSRNASGWKKAFYIANGFVLAVLTHGLWNFLATAHSYVQGDDTFINIVMRFELLLIFGSLLALYFFSIRYQSRLIIRELKEESEKGLFPIEHVGYFASLVRHPKKYILPKDIDSKTYAHLGVKLAFRKDEYKNNPHPKLKNEIESLQNQLKELVDYQPDSLNLIYGK